MITNNSQTNNQNSEIQNQAKKLWHEVFNDKKKFIEQYFNVFNAQKNLKYIADNDNIISMLVACSYNWFYNELKLPFAYLSGILTSTNYRKQGFCSNLIKDTLLELYKEDYALCGLIAANEPLTDYYKKFDFSCCLKKEDKTFSRRQIDKRLVDSYFLLQNANFTQANIFQYLSCKNNAVSHNKDTLSLYNNKEYLRLAATVSGSVRAFAVAKKTKNFIDVLDISFSNLEGRQALLSLIAYTYKKDVNYQCQSYLSETDNYSMLRIINARKCLEAYAFTHPAEDMYITVKDNVILQNNITVHLYQGEVLNVSPSYNIPVIDILFLSSYIFANAYMFLMLDR